VNFAAEIVYPEEIDKRFSKYPLSNSVLCKLIIVDVNTIIKESTQNIIPTSFI
jgi:hypothetical protein